MAGDANQAVSTVDFDKTVTQEAAEVEAALQRVRGGAPEPEQTPAQEAGAEPPPPEQTAEPAKPEPAPSAEAKPQEQPPADDRKGEGWKMYRKEQQARRQLEERLAKLEQNYTEVLEQRAGVKPKEETPAEPTFETDPANYLKHRTETAEERLARLEADTAQTRQNDLIRAQEAVFTKDHPDYVEAINHFVQAETSEFKESGQEALAVRRFQGMAQRDDNFRKEVEKAALEGGISEDEVLTNIARTVRYNSRRQEIIEGATALGRSVPEHAYALAQRRGYQSKAAQPVTTQQPPQSSDAEAEAARQRVQQAKRISEASKTLSEMDTTPAPQPRQLTREAVMEMDDAEFAALEESNPGWHRSLF